MTWVRLLVKETLLDRPLVVEVTSSERNAVGKSKEESLCSQMQISHLMALAREEVKLVSESAVVHLPSQLPVP